MEALQLPKTTEMNELLSFIMKNKIPISREGLLQAETFVKSVPHRCKMKRLLQSKRWRSLKLPFTESVFRSLFSVESKEGLHTVLSALKGAC